MELFIGHGLVHADVDLVVAWLDAALSSDVTPMLSTSASGLGR